MLQKINNTITWCSEHGYIDIAKDGIHINLVHPDQLKCPDISKEDLVANMALISKEDLSLLGSLIVDCDAHAYHISN